MGKVFIIVRLHLHNSFPFPFERKYRLSKTADFGSFWIILDHLDHFGSFWTIFEKYTMVPNSVPNIKTLAALVQDISGGVDFDPPLLPVLQNSPPQIGLISNTGLSAYTNK